MREFQDKMLFCQKNMVKTRKSHSTMQKSKQEKTKEILRVRYKPECIVHLKSYSLAEITTHRLTAGAWAVSWVNCSL